MLKILTKEQLLEDLYEAYYGARKHKRNKTYQKVFEKNLERNLRELCDELYSRTYKPRPSSCFIVNDPKKREVFAAEFRDRIVHHLYYNYTHVMYERTFIKDTYSCIKGRGTHFGVARLRQHIRSASNNYTVPCYIMKMDIRGYFMHINRQKLLDVCNKTIDRMQMHRVSKHRETRWNEVVDIDFVHYLTHEIVLLNPINDCNIVGKPSEWDGLPHDKSLYYSPRGCGLPIGNLTSQLFSNVYLNLLDQYAKRELRCKHYGRYVDDFYIVSSDREWLAAVVSKIKAFLIDELGLDFHDGKLKVTSAWHGAEFLGAWVKPHRVYMSRHSTARIKAKLRILADEPPEKWFSAMNSYCGVLSHWHNYNLRRRILLSEKSFQRYGIFNIRLTKYFVAN